MKQTDLQRNNASFSLTKRQKKLLKSDLNTRC